MPATPAKEIKDNGNGTTTVTKTCPFCQKDAVVTVGTEAWKAWDNGRGPFLQDLMPGVPAGDRETLISGSHESCFDEAFPSEDDGPTFAGFDA